MTQITKKEIEQKLKDIDKNLSPEDKLELLKELNKMLDETNDAVEDFIKKIKEQELKKSIQNTF